MISTRFRATVSAAVLPTFGGKFRQVAPGAVGHVARARRQYHGDGVVFAQFLEDRQNFSDRVAAQSVSFFRPVDRNLRYRAACFEDSEFPFFDHEMIPFFDLTMTKTRALRLGSQVQLEA